MSFGQRNQKKIVDMTDTQQKFLFTGYLSELEITIIQNRGFTVLHANDESSGHIRFWGKN